MCLVATECCQKARLSHEQGSKCVEHFASLYVGFSVVIKVLRHVFGCHKSIRMR